MDAVISCNSPCLVLSKLLMRVPCSCFQIAPYCHFCPQYQENWAIAKMTAWCALYMGTLKSRGSGMAPFERALVSFYRPSIVTFPLSLRVSQILPLLCSRTSLFRTPPLVSPKFFHVPLGLGGWPSGCAANSKGVALIVRAISFQDFHPVWSWSTNVTDRQTDGRHAISRPRFAI